MSTIIQAEAIISARDNTGAAFASASKHIKDFAKQSAQVDNLTKSIKGVQSQLQAVERYRSATGGLKEFSNSQKQAAQQLRAVREAMAAVDKPTREMQRQLARAQQEADRTTQAFKRQGAIAREARSALEGMGVPINQLASKQEHLRTALTQTTHALEQQVIMERRVAAAHSTAEKAAERRAEGMRHHGIVNYALGGAAAYVGAHGVMSGIERTVEAGAEYRHEIIGLQNAGRTPEEIAAIERRSRQVVSRLPTAGYTENLKVIAETTPAFGSVEHAMDHLEFMQKAMSVLKASGGEHIKGGVGDVGRALAKTFEERFTKSENFEAEAGAMIPAMVASGGVFNPDQLYAFAQQAKSSLPNYSMRFLSRIAPSLIGAMGGDRAGTAANAFTSIVNGKVNDKKQAEQWERFGLLDDSMVIKKSGNVVSWKSGAVKNTALALSDPLQWFETVALPAMAAKGVDINERLPLAQELATMFRNQNGNMFASEMAQADSRSRLHKDEALTNRVGSLDTIYRRNLGDFHVGLDAFKTSLGNLMATVSSPLMGNAARGLSGFASTVDSFANMMQRHPEVAAGTGMLAAGGAIAGAGYASYQLMNGFGLGTSAAALDSSAAALHGAAAALDGAAVKSGLGGGFFGWGKKAAAAEAATIEAGTLEATIAGTGALSLAEGLTIASVGTLAIAGVTAVSLIAALSQGKKKLASDDPNFGNPFGPKFQMPMTIGGPAMNAGGGGHGHMAEDERPYTIEVGRGGVRSRHYLTAPAPFRGALPTFAAGWNADTATLGYLPGQMFGNSVSVPMGRIGTAPMESGRSLIGAPAPTVDVTGKVQADVKTDVDVRFKLDVPPGFGVTKEFQSTVTRIGSTGPTMPQARDPGLKSVYG